MSYNLYDWNNALRQRDEYVEDRLKDGSPIIAVSYDDGILLLTLRKEQRKIFEVYDRLMMGALGKQSDIEALRIAAIDTAHKEGFERSPDDVSIQRLVGFALSPAVKRVYNDQQTIPLTVRAIFVEMGKAKGEDHLFVLGFDGEFKTQTGQAVAAGTSYAEEQALESLRAATITTFSEALSAALTAWGVGRSQLAPKKAADADEYELDPLGEPSSDAPKVSDDPTVALREAFKDGLTIEAAVMERATNRETKFRLLRPSELDAASASYK